MTNYSRGTDFERRVAKLLQREGYEVFRSAGSRGKADLVAIKPGQILLIQCKRDGEIDRDEWNEVWALAQRIDPHGSTAVGLLAYMPGKRGIAFRRLVKPLARGDRREPASSVWTPDRAEEQE